MMHNNNNNNNNHMEIKYQKGALPSKDIEECELHYSNHDIEDIYKRWDSMIENDQWPGLELVLSEVIEKLDGIYKDELEINESEVDDNENGKRIRNESDQVSNKKRKKNKCSKPFSEMSYVELVCPILQKHKLLVRKAVVLYAYQVLVAEQKIARNAKLESLLVTKKSKSESGVLVITVLTSPYPTVNNVKQRFSCKWNCYYCPNQPGQPRSYLRDEPAVLRANQNGFDPVLQFIDRAAILAQNGHPVDKVELLVLGGTWSSYQTEYQEAFIRDLFYAANTFMCRAKRPRCSLLEEQLINEKAVCKIIGITLETRPDCINKDELYRFRKYGCTRVQLGIQHTDNRILKKINRECTIEDAQNAIKLLKDACFKIDIHLMPNLPGASPELDNAMFQRMLTDDTLQADQWKIYPCEVTPWTVIKKWFDDGKFVPYKDEDLFEVILNLKAQIHPWIRLNRIVRDIPVQYIKGGVVAPNLRQDLPTMLKKRNQCCRCIRCREVGLQNREIPAGTVAVLKRRIYASSGGTEYFLSFESEDESILFGFLRLRIPSRDEKPIFPELENAALVRELHVYGKLVATVSRDATTNAYQHTGFGHRLLQEAERIASEEYKLDRLAVISGVGTRNYYAKFGYHINHEEPGQFSIKTNINKRKPATNLAYISAGVLALALFVTPIIGSILDP